MPKNRVENRKDSFWNRSLFYVFLTSEKEEPTSANENANLHNEKGTAAAVPLFCLRLLFFGLFDAFGLHDVIDQGFGPLEGKIGFDLELKRQVLELLRFVAFDRGGRIGVIIGVQGIEDF